MLSRFEAQKYTNTGIYSSIFKVSIKISVAPLDSLSEILNLTE